MISAVCYSCYDLSSTLGSLVRELADVAVFLTTNTPHNDGAECDAPRLLGDPGHARH